MAAGPTRAQLEGPDAAAHLAALREAGEVAWVDAVGGWVVTGHAAAVAVMRDAATYTVDDPRFSTGRVLGPSMLSVDGVEHHRHRRPFVEAFRSSRVEERYAEEVQALTDDLLARVRDDGRADLRRALAGPLAVAVTAHALGIEDVEAGTVLRWYAALVDAVTRLSAAGDADGAPDPAAASALRELTAHLDAGTAQDGVLAGAAGRLTDAEVVSNAAVMLFGGVETAEGMVAAALAHLLGSTDEPAAVRRDPARAALVVEESLRLEPAAAAVDRYATRDVEVAGARVRRGDLVRVSLTAANRDPAVFADPDRFDPGRDRLREQLAFARGPHVCLAMDLARLEARVAVAAVARLPGVRLERAEPPTGLVFRKPAAVVAAWDAGPHHRRGAGPTSAPAR